MVWPKSQLGSYAFCQRDQRYAWNGWTWRPESTTEIASFNGGCGLLTNRKMASDQKKYHGQSSRQEVTYTLPMGGRGDLWELCGLRLYQYVAALKFNSHYPQQYWTNYVTHLMVITCGCHAYFVYGQTFLALCLRNGHNVWLWTLDFCLQLSL